MCVKRFKNGYECKLRSSTEGLHEQAEQSYKINRRELAKSDVTRGSQTKNGLNPEHAVVRSCMNCPELKEPADLPLTGDVPSIDSHEPPTSPCPPLTQLGCYSLGNTRQSSMQSSSQENHFYF